ncbi:MAG: ribbon-helix-helix domain-containing protein [Chloroflexota bacterium]|nr:ribbon-helix-helix domain-containing protein [Chloroflexota bacterium]
MVRTTITLPKELLEQIDEFAEDGERSAWIVETVEARLRREHLGRVIEETRGAIKDSETWPTAEATYRWVRELREEGEP